MIDFGALVLGPAMAAFAQPITLTPVKSQPGAPAYAARGSFSYKPVEIAQEDGGFHQTNAPALGVRLADFPVRPKQGDAIAMSQGAFVIYNVVIDGQGGADLILRETDRA